MVSDPLKNLAGQEHRLFQLFTQMSTGHNLDAVMGAAVNVLINAIRQNYPLRKDAEQKIDELFGRGKQMLLANHYDTTTGRRRTVIPHTQVVRMPYVIDKDIDPRKTNGR
jgi:hypothetical protein